MLPATVRYPRVGSVVLALAATALAATACASSGGPATASAPPARVDSGAYVFLLGHDTIGVEHFVRTPSSLTVRQVLRSPRATARHYTMTFDPQGALSAVDVTSFPQADNTSGTPSLRVTATISGDSARVVQQRGDSTQTRTVAVRPGSLYAPFQSYVPFELMAMRARAQGRDTVEIPVLGLGAQQPPPAKLVRFGADSMLIIQPNITYRAGVTSDGRLTGLHAPDATFKVIVRRAPTVDLASIAGAWSAQEAMGQASPRDTAHGMLPGGHVLVDYGRPARRGRTVWGGQLVPFDSVWRTGANAATRLVTDRDLVIGGVTVPAGTYTLWTATSRTGPHRLVISKLTTAPNGQPLWGTNYNPSQDLARVDLQSRRLDQPLERFTIVIEPQGQGGVLRMGWDTTEVFVPFTFR